MNLYDFSQNNNIEFGIVTKVTLLGSITGNIGNSIDKDAFDYFNSVIEKSNCVYKRVPVFENKMMGLSKRYVKSKVEIDSLLDVFKSTRNHATKLVKHEGDKIGKMGFCIRTGEEIKFDLEMPLSEKAFVNWKKFENDDYPEKFCHYSGETTNGETSFSKPILKKNWRKAKS
jgi:hypothetical protein